MDSSTIAGICAIFGALGSAVVGLIWLLKLVFRISRLIAGLEMSQLTLEQKVTKLIKLFSRLEEHNVRLAVLETKVENIRAQNGKHEDYES